MRTLQIILLFLAVLVFVAAAFFTGSDTGLNLWYTGVATLLVDAVVCLIWPTTARSRNSHLVLNTGRSLSVT